MAASEFSEFVSIALFIAVVIALVGISVYLMCTPRKEKVASSSSETSQSGDPQQ
ncbi:hypothetical protein D2E26_0036 [Bifidobacterium dolichotidis]|uniref:Uncharacterized protein n=1 Tax=Bifidobacterium dolichotidis TaxID=2306976 RepID=A0A430FRJ6_9BIFI|nr:hypothetical protein [Bifidobacterium dolichotidis]RSX55473.1 hypothetical protein D2E26_0036 [Bifidobacterium dolichotidis]